MGTLPELGTIEFADPDGYEVRLWSHNGNDYVVIGRTDTQVQAYTLLADACSIIGSWIPSFVAAKS